MKLSIDKVNWPDAFPYCPETSVEIDNNHDFLFLKYTVKGEQLRAATIDDQGPVWEDSCVEFFCQVPGDRHYMNFETNCVGAMVASCRLGRDEDVQPFSPDEMALIERKCTFPREVIEEKDGLFEWTVELKIPLKLIFQNPQPQPAAVSLLGATEPSTQSKTNELSFPLKLRANFYKCADKTKKPHFVSWQPINLPSPNFHCPEFFGEIVLK